QYLEEPFATRIQSILAGVRFGRCLQVVRRGVQGLEARVARAYPRRIVAILQKAGSWVQDLRIHVKRQIWPPLRLLCPAGNGLAPVVARRSARHIAVVHPE